MATERDMVKEIDDLLRSIINILIDGQEGFQTIEQDLKDDEAKRSFLAGSEKRREFKADLESVLHSIKIDHVDEHGTAIGTVHRTWGDLKAKLGGSDHTLLETADQGEEVAVHTYKTALEKELLLPIRRILTVQHAHIQEAYENVKALREATE